jgi:two-component system chemotaxis response regulator CheB
MPGHDIIVIGASAGGVEALTHLIAGLPHDIPAAIFVVLHISPHGTSVLPSILRRAGRLPVQHAADGDEIRTGHVYIAPPDLHLLIRGDKIRLSRGPTENASRPAIDPLFRSAATSYGPRVIGAVLSGVLDDGTAGLIAIKRCGGIAVAQNPDEALFDGMPRSAIEHAFVDFIVPVAEMAAIFDRLAREPVELHEGTTPMAGEMENEVRIDDMDEAAMHTTVEEGPPSALTCPECQGALWELHEGDLVRFRCRVGHAYSAETLLAEQSDALEAAMWQAFRALKESAALARKLGDRSAARGSDRVTEQFRQQEREAEERAAIIRQALLRGTTALQQHMHDGVSAHLPDLAHRR